LTNNPLFCIVCGFERGGTTLAAELIRQHPDIDGRFECGFLLVDDMADFAKLEIYPDNLKAGWGLSDEDFAYICASPSHLVAYKRLVERSNIPDKTVRIFDKTPRYMQRLKDILFQIDVPCICVVRDPRALYWSRQKHWDKKRLILGPRWRKIYRFLERMPLPSFIRRLERAFFRWRHTINRFNLFSGHYVDYSRGWQEANHLFSDRILLVRHEELCTNPKVETQRIYEFLGLEFKEAYLTLPTVPDPYVNRGGILTDFIYEYRQGLSKRNQRYLLKKTKEFSEWHWHE
jgi:hypothetical protein